MPQLENNNKEFEKIYRTYYKKMFGICMNYVHNETVAQDLLQDAFIIVINKLYTLKDKTKLESWISSVVKNTAISYIRKKKLFADISVSDISDTAGDDNSSEDDNMQSISYDTMMNMVEKLPEGYKNVFKLSVIEGLSNQEIAQRLNIQPNSASSQLFRAKKMLKSMINSYWTLGVLPLLIIAFLLFRFYGSGNSINDNEFASGNNQILFNAPNKQHHSADTLVADIDVPLHRIDTCKKTHKKESYLNIVADTLSETAFTDTVSSYDDNGMPQEIPVINLKDVVIAENHVELSEHIPVDSYYKPVWSVKADIASLGSGNVMYQDGILADNSIPSFTENTDLLYLQFSEVKYHRPVAVNFAVNVRLNKYWSFDGGFVYSWLRTDFISQDTSLSYRLQYAGIKTQLMYHFVRTKIFDAYAGLGGSFELPVYNKGEIYVNSTEEKFDIKAANQFSVSLSIGLSAKITDKIDIFLQPQASYFFDNGDKIATNRKNNKLGADFPIGIRIKL